MINLIPKLACREVALAIIAFTAAAVFIATVVGWFRR
jgi:hypothetical protein